MVVMPFEFFRKRRQAVLATITIFVMFLFIIGDPLTGAGRAPGVGETLGGRLYRWLGGGDHLATVAGKGVDGERLAELLLNRQTAHSLLRGFAELAQDRFLVSLGIPRATADNQQLRSQKFSEIQAKNPSAFDPILSAQATLCSLAASTLTPSSEPQALVDFLTWKHRADDLGIVLTPEWVEADFRDFTLKQIPERELRALTLRQFRRNFEDLLPVLVDEIRVALAQQILRGQSPRSSLGQRVGQQLTPYDLWQAYVALKTDYQVGILPVPADPQRHRELQQAHPGADELRTLYDRHKSQEPHPASDTPGFKIPRKYRFAFVYVDINETTPSRKHYRKWHESLQTLAPAATLHALVSAYNQRKEVQFKIPLLFVDVPAGGTADGRMIRWRLTPDVQQHRAELAALLTANWAGTPTPVLAWIPTAAPVPEPQHAALVAASFVGHVTSGLAGLCALPHAQRLGQEDRFQPLTDVMGGLLDEREEESVRNLVLGDLKLLEEDLKKYGKAYEEALGKYRRAMQRDKTAVFTPPPLHGQPDADAYLQQYATARGCTYEKMTEARSKLALLDEPDKKLLNTFLKPLIANVLPGFDEQRIKDITVQQLVDIPRGLYDARPMVPSAGPAKTYALQWKVEETPERVPTFEQCQAQVLQAWRQIKARDLAKDEAEKIAAKSRKSRDNDRLLKDDSPGYRDFEVIARFRPSGQATAPVPTYERATIPIIDFPPADFHEQVAKHLKQPGDVLVVANQPKTSWYVIFLKDRRGPQATDPLTLSRFDFEVILPNLTRQLQVDNRSFLEFAAQERYGKMEEQWRRYTELLTRFDPEKAKEIAERLRSLSQ